MPIDKHEWPVLIVSGEFDAATDEGCRLRDLKKQLVENTEAFVEGRRANNCLLFGDSGTGKSTCIKAILNQYYEKGLRLIEVYKHQFQDLSAIIDNPFAKA